jgi:hypothetical protein
LQGVVERRNSKQYPNLLSLTDALSAQADSKNVPSRKGSLERRVLGEVALDRLTYALEVNKVRKLIVIL